MSSRLRNRKQSRVKCRIIWGLFPDVKAKVSDIAVLYNIVFAFKPEQSLFGSGGERTTLHEILEARHFGTNKTSFDIRMDLSCRLRGYSSLRDSPGANLVLTCCQKGNQVKQPVANLDDTIGSQLWEAKRFQVLVSIFLG